MTSEPRRAFVSGLVTRRLRPGRGRPPRCRRPGARLQLRPQLPRAGGSDPALPAELPLSRGPIPPRVGEVAGCIADAGPDAWGQRVILNRLTGSAGADTTDLTPLTYLLGSGSDRTGALDFQASAEEYTPRSLDQATLDELAESAERVELGVPLSPALDQALLHGKRSAGRGRRRCCATAVAS